MNSALYECTRSFGGRERCFNLHGHVGESDLKRAAQRQHCDERWAALAQFKHRNVGAIETCGVTEGFLSRFSCGSQFA